MVANSNLRVWRAGAHRAESMLGAHLSFGTPPWRGLDIEHMFVCRCGVTDYDFAQRAVLAALLDAHPGLLGVDELDDQLATVSRTREALRVLVDDGLATKLGDRVGASRAAVRFKALQRPA